MEQLNSRGFSTAGFSTSGFSAAGFSTSSFTELLTQRGVSLDISDADLTQIAPHGTTIVAALFPGGVVMAGDRRATMGHLVAMRDVKKVYPVDRHTVMGVAGTAGIALALHELFSVELEHYEKIEQTNLSLPGKAQRLATLVRSQLGLALRGLVVVPLLAGWDIDRQEAKIYSYDATGGRYEETSWAAIGSGSPYAKGSLKKLYRPDLSLEETITLLVQALVDAADDDTATAGVDTNRGIYPTVVSITADGVHQWRDDELAEIVGQVTKSRQIRPDGPGAPVL